MLITRKRFCEHLIQMGFSDKYIAKAAGVHRTFPQKVRAELERKSKQKYEVKYGIEPRTASA